MKVANWLSRDPIAERGGINLYGYVGNDPIRFIDPLGLVNLELENNFGSFGNVTDFQNVNPSGVYSVHGHGGPDSMEDDRMGTAAHPYGSDIDPQTLLNIMLQNGYKMGTPVILYSCQTGSGGDNSFAAKLSALTGGSVIASTTDIVHPGDGTFTNGNDNWVTYTNGSADDSDSTPIGPAGPVTSPYNSKRSK